jgi:hypothetical protein
MEVNNSVLIPLSRIRPNRGQIEGLKKNPRVIKDATFEKMKKSIEDAPEMMALRELLVYPHEDGYVIIGGEMRFRAMKDLGYKESPCKVIPKETPVEKLAEYVLKDNASFGQWDFDELKEWDAELLDDCEISLHAIEDIVENEVEDEEGRSAEQLGEVKDNTTLSIPLKDSEEYARVIDALMAFDVDLRAGLLKALGI